MGNGGSDSGKGVDGGNGGVVTPSISALKRLGIDNDIISTLGLQVEVSQSGNWLFSVAAGTIVNV